MQRNRCVRAYEAFIGSLFANGPSRSLGSNNHRLGRRRRNRRAIIGEGTDARQVLVGRTSHRGTSQDEGQGKDEAGSPHLTVSGRPWPAAPAVSLPRDNRRLFPDICAKTENGFVAQENCFVGPAGRNNGRKSSMNSAATPSRERIRLTRKAGRWGRFGPPPM